MNIEYIDAAYNGDNVSKKLEIFVDEDWRSLDVYLYFVPVVGDEVYSTREPIELGNNGKATYVLPGDVLNGEGYFGAQVVCIDPNGAEIAKSAVYTFECGASIDDNSAVLPTGEVITLAQLLEKLNNLNASEIFYDDTQHIGAATVQEAIDYAIVHGGGGTSTPTYLLNYYDNPTDAQRSDNLRVINAFRALTLGSYRVYVKIQNQFEYIEADQIHIGNSSTPSIQAYFNYFQSYEDKPYLLNIGSSTPTTYNQSKTALVETGSGNYDIYSPIPPSMELAAEYISERIGTEGNLNPSSYASAADVNAIEAVIPSAASASNQLADKNFVNSSISTNTAHFVGTFDSVAELEAYSGTVTNNDYAYVVIYDPVEPTEVKQYDRYKYTDATHSWEYEYSLVNPIFTAAQWAAINSAITSSKVLTYDAHVADTTIHVTSQNKSDWNAKYDLPANGIPKTDLASSVQTSLGLADSALQSIGQGTGIEVSGNTISLDSTTQNTLGSVADKQNKPTLVTSGTNITLADNTEYRLTDVTTLTLTYPSGSFECWLRLTFASSGTITVTLPTSSYIGTAPMFSNGETWELSIKDGVVVAGKVEASS